MFGDENERGFEQQVRSLANEVGRSLEQAIDGLDVEVAARSVGVDPESAREWADSAGRWLRTQIEELGDEMASHAAATQRAFAPKDPLDPLAGTLPHPLDLPTDAQGLALAALSSGRWIVEPSNQTLVATGDGPPPEGALGTVLELRIRDWITTDGQLTTVGGHALARWLDAAGR